MSEVETECVHLWVSGRVQGVGFRFFTQRVAAQLGVYGYVRNLPDGRVEVLAEGSPEQLDQFEQLIRRGPWSGLVTSMEVQRSPSNGNYSHFQIRY